MFSKLLITASALATAATAATIHVDNHCGFDLYLTSAFGSARHRRTIYGDPLKADGFRLDSAGNGYDIVSPKDRQGELEHAYTPSNPNGNGAVFTDSTGGDFTLALCSS
ncbi:hypothetical protein Tdes44962_MAKER10224 [Teratosphaeria destructans]|uniref:Uncharacterized protein n=1 Tax=Teratosphaeria destructans TaxID=418781 RepID=A0A9W7W074_9PEZI|nr:hypothetical protein Tdes44962_MAKER10224 [Teratosphaeria destructans]